jgi:regulator of protease activity HflC (stomatin/prohibitin superfamily)
MKSAFLLCLTIGATTGCATSTIEPGHRGLYFAPNDGGLARTVLPPGKYQLGWCFLYCTPNRVDDFDVTYSTHTEEVRTKSSEGLDLDLKLSVIFRPIVSELYQLDTEIGANYYDEVIAPEFRSACRGVFARHSYTELQKKNEGIENEVEAEVRRRTAGRHVEIASVTLEGVNYAPEIAQKIREKLAGEQEASREQAAIAWEAEKKKEILQSSAEQKRLEFETADAQKKIELQVARADAELSRMRAQAEADRKVIAAKAEAEAARQMAKAHAEERRAETAGVTPMEVMEHAYDALGQLGGKGTTIVLGDWAHVPSFLFPRVPSLQNAFTLPLVPYAPPNGVPEAPAKPEATLSAVKPPDNPY